MFIKSLKKKDKKELFLEKSIMREMSLLSATMWMEEFCRNIKKLVGAGQPNTIIRYRKGESVVNAYFSKKDVNRLLNAIACVADISFVKNICQKFIKLFEEFLPYLKKKKKIDSREELKTFYCKYKEYCSYLAIIFYIPNISSLPEENRAIAMEARKKTERYADIFDEIMMDYLKNFKKLDDLEIKILLPEEAFGYKKISIKKIKERKEGYLLYKDRIYTGAAIRNFILEKKVRLDDEKVERTEMIKGQTAYRGLVSGEVKIVLRVQDSNKIREGNILVSSMATPRYLPAMKRAIAFVTDEGGVTCHAAIIACEMKKPCIVGTKIATQVLKDGDLVEVDANKGIIKILKRTQ